MSFSFCGDGPKLRMKKTYLKLCVQNWAKSANGGHEKDLQ